MSTPESKRVRTATRRKIVRAFVRRLAAPALMLAGAALLQLFALLSPRLVEQLYSRRIFPHLAAFLSAIFGRFTFSVGELMLSCAAILVAVLICVRAFRAFRPGDTHTPRTRAVRLLCDLGIDAAWVLSAAALAFMLIFGLNYQREPLAETLGYEQRAITADELEPMAAEVVEGINHNYEEAHAADASVPDDAAIVRILEESYARLAKAVPASVPAGDYSPPKPLAFSGAFTRAGISGIYSPPTGEANYNRLLPDFQRPFAMAHEMAHQRGFARESEANFVAFLVCTQSLHPFVRYSGYRNGLGLLSELWRVAPERARELFRKLGQGYRADSETAYRFWSRGAGRLASVSNSINDIYLKANRVRSGTGNYSESTALLIGYYLKRGRAPDFSADDDARLR